MPKSGFLEVKSGKSLLNVWPPIGQVGTTNMKISAFGQAGRKHSVGKKPHVRGVVMNPVDHPMGGGEGNASCGRGILVLPGEMRTKGHNKEKTKETDKYIVKRRG